MMVVVLMMAFNFAVSQRVLCDRSSLPSVSPFDLFFPLDPCTLPSVTPYCAIPKFYTLPIRIRTILPFYCPLVTFHFSAETMNRGGMANRSEKRNG